MPPVVAPNGALRLPTGQVTVLLGPAAVRERVTALLDESTARCSAGHDGGALRLTAGAHDSAQDRVRAVSDAAERRPSLVLVDRLTDGLTGPERRTVLTALRRLAATGVAVLVDDLDPVAALATADVALRVGADGSLAADSLLPAL